MRTGHSARAYRFCLSDHNYHLEEQKCTRPKRKTTHSWVYVTFLSSFCPFTYKSKNLDMISILPFTLFSTIGM